MKKHEEILHFNQISEEKNYLVIRHPYEYRSGVPEILTGTGKQVFEMIKDIFIWDPDDYEDFNDFLTTANENNCDGWDYLQITELPTI